MEGDLGQNSEMDRTSRQMNRTLGKWIVHQGNGSYITQMSRTSREVDLTRKCIVLRKSIVTDGKELGQQSKAQARLPSAIFVFLWVFECFSSEFQVKYIV